MSDRLLQPLTHLPQSTGSWTCRYFLTIVFLSVVLVVLGATVIPGVLGILAIGVGCLSAGLTIGMRRPGEACEV